jgi:hypothetical protein
LPAAEIEVFGFEREVGPAKSIKIDNVIGRHSSQIGDAESDLIDPIEREASQCALPVGVRPADRQGACAIHTVDGDGNSIGSHACPFLCNDGEGELGGGILKH